MLVLCLPAGFNVVLWLTLRSKRKCSLLGMCVFVLLTFAIGYFNAELIQGIRESL